MLLYWIKEENKKLFFTCFKTHTRIAEDKFSSGLRIESISDIIEAIDFFCSFAIFCRHSMNSGSIDMLVW